MSMVSDVLKSLDDDIAKAMDAFGRELAKVRTGRANSNMLDGIRLDYYGTPTPLNQVASVSVADPRLIVVKPWEKRIIPDIEKAIRDAGLGVNPSSDGEIVRLPIPPLTQERRKELTKVVKRIGEDARVAVRNCRRDARELLEQAGKDREITEDDVEQGLKKIQAVIDKAIEKIDGIADKKQAEIMEV
jgi:ribosome recycling factor